MSQSKNYLENVAIVGAGGQVGTFITNALLEQGKHKITAITREGSTNPIPDGVAVKRVNYDDPSSLSSALQGQDVLIITMGVTASPDTSQKLVDAAKSAGIHWILPNEWGFEADTQAGKDIMVGPRVVATREYIEKAGLNYIGVCCGFWYEFSLAGTEARYGFDFDNKTVTFYDDGKTKINTSTWPLTGLATAKLLALPVQSDDGSPSLERYRNSQIFCSSFSVSQRDMFDSVLRVTGTKESDWTISHEDVKKRFARGIEMMQKGSMVGFGIMMYARIFFPDGAGSFESDNEVLGLPREDLDEYTKVAVEMAGRQQIQERYKSVLSRSDNKQA